MTCGTSGLKDIRPGQLYAYRVDGPYQPREGHRFNFNKLLLDPFATAISRDTRLGFRTGARIRSVGAGAETWFVRPLDDAGAMPKCVFTHEQFHWQDDLPPRHPWSETVIYETHVARFHDSIPAPVWSIPAPTAA